MALKKTPTSEPTARSSKSALLEAANQAIADQKSRPAPRPAPAPRRTALRGLMAAVLLTSAAVLVAQPVWLTGPTLPPEESVIKAATATMALVKVMSRVEAYQVANGTLPNTLVDAGVADSAITYRAAADGDFELSMRAGDSVVSIRATDSLKTRVVEAIRALQTRTSR